MKRTLLTGFGPFLSVVNNPSQRLVEHFARYGAAAHQLTTHVFPVSYTSVADGVNQLLGMAGETPYDLVLMLGVNTGAFEWRIEQFGANADTSGSADRDGVKASGSAILPGLEALLPSTLPTDRIVEALNEVGIPATLSDSAGGYLCNHLMFRALARLQSAPDTIGGFIHIPADPITIVEQNDNATQSYPSFEDHILAIQTILNELA